MLFLMKKLLKAADQTIFNGRIHKTYFKLKQAYHLHRAKTLGEKFHYHFYHSHLFEDQWMGVPCTQNPLDMWIKQKLIWQTKPDFIIETGTYKGGSSLFYATLFEAIGHGKVITLDWAPQIEEASHHPLFQKRVTSIQGETTSQEVFQQVKRLVDNKTAMVILDSNHSCDHVLKELQLYSGFVSKENYLIVEDTNVNGHPVLPHFGPGPFEAVKQFLKTRADFVVDKACEKFCVTFFPSGFLKRVSL